MIWLPTIQRGRLVSIKKDRNERLFDNLCKVTKEYFSGKSFVPHTFKELAETLHIHCEHIQIFRKVLAHLTAQKVIKLVDKRYTTYTSSELLTSGILRVHARGFGFLQPDDRERFSQDIFIPKHLTQSAVDGDHVEVSIHPIVSEKGPEGRVVSISQRSHTHLGVTIRQINRREEPIGYAPLLGEDRSVVIDPKGQTLEVGDRVVVKIDHWGDREKDAQGQFSHYIGSIYDPSKDIEAAIAEFELLHEFSADALQESKHLGNRVSSREISNRRDLRSWEIVTIDPASAKDFDDAISLTKKGEGYQLGVHIADVSFYVRPGSALDREAKERCNSTYFPNRCIPMLPPSLADNLCSLKPKVNRLTVTVYISFDREGTVVDYTIFRSVIKSAKRFSYEEAKEVLEGKRKSKYLPLLQDMTKLCSLLKKKRFERGGIEFALPEVVVEVDSEGEPTGTRTVNYDITHQMIEEFMLKANEIIAKHLSEKDLEVPYRVHEAPAEESLRDFSTTATALGFTLSDQPKAAELQRLFEQASTTAHHSFLTTSYIRSMKLAIYSAENIGHYGLCLDHYCHFTSPIRRYIDLVIHRTLFAGESTEVAAIARGCNDQERLSAKAEQSVLLLKKLRLLDSLKRQNPLSEYRAIITKVKPFGFFFELTDLLLEGFIHISKLSSDYFIYEGTFLRGRRSEKIYQSGDQISVSLAKVDLIMLDSLWEILEERVTGKKRGKRKR